MCSDSTTIKPKFELKPHTNYGSMSDSFVRAQTQQKKSSQGAISFGQTPANTNTNEAGVPKSALYATGAIVVGIVGAIAFHKWNRSELGFVKKALDKVVGKENHAKFANWVNSKIIEPSLNYIENVHIFKTQNSPLDINNLPIMETRRLGRIGNETFHIHTIFKPGETNVGKKMIKEEFFPLRHERIPPYPISGDNYDAHILAEAAADETPVSQGLYVVISSTKNKFFSFKQERTPVAGARLIFDKSENTTPDLKTGIVQAFEKFAPNTHTREEAFKNIQKFTGIDTTQPFTFYEVTGATAHVDYGGRSHFKFEGKTLAQLAQRETQILANRMNLTVGLGSFTEQNTARALEASHETGKFGLVIIDNQDFPVRVLEDVFGPGTRDRLYCRIYSHLPKVKEHMIKFETNEELRMPTGEFPRQIWTFEEVLASTSQFKKHFSDLDAADLAGKKTGTRFERMATSKIIRTQAHSLTGIGIMSLSGYFALQNERKNKKLEYPIT